MDLAATERTRIRLTIDGVPRRAVLQPVGFYGNTAGQHVTIAQDLRSHQLVAYAGSLPAEVRPVRRWDLAADIVAGARAGHRYDLPPGSLRRTVEWLATRP